jgi:hypothetical protein
MESTLRFVFDDLKILNPDRSEAELTLQEYKEACDAAISHVTQTMLPTIVLNSYGISEVHGVMEMTRNGFIVKIIYHTIYTPFRSEG